MIFRPQRSLLLFVALMAACSGKATDRPAGIPVATVGEKTISDVDLKAKLAAQPAFTLAGYKSVARKKEFLDGVIRQELLLQEARRRGLENDPEVRTAVERILVHKLTRLRAEEEDKKTAVPEAELRRYYDQHRSEFVVPTRVRIGHLFLAVPEKDPRRVKSTVEAGRLVAQLKAKEAKGDKQAFEAAVAARSEDAATKATGGDLGYRTREQLAQAWGPELADAVFAIKGPGELGPPVLTPRGLHLVKVLGRQEGSEASFDSARSRIESRLKLDRRSHSVDDLVAELKEKTKVEIHEQALEKLEVGPVLPPVGRPGGRAADGGPPGAR
jgi:peptidyl-prolyl cis-trans isomerase C